MLQNTCLAGQKASYERESWSLNIVVVYKLTGSETSWVKNHMMLRASWETPQQPKATAA